MGRARKARAGAAGGGEARAHACEWGRAVASAEGMKSPRGAIILPELLRIRYCRRSRGRGSNEFLHANNVGGGVYKNYEETRFQRMKRGARMNQNW